MNNDLRVRPAGARTTLRPMQAGDVVAMHRLSRQMSWPHRLEDCAQLFALSAGSVAVDAAGLTVGVGLRWSFGDVGTIGLVLVAPDCQGRGIGRALMTALIDDLSPRALMLNATAEGLELYKKLGFVSTGFVRQHQAWFDDAPVLPSAPNVAVRRALPADHAALCALDAAAFGADRSALISRLLVNGEAWLVERAGLPSGFAVLRAFGRGAIIGPVVAPGEDEAIALVAAAAKAAPSGVLRVDIDADAGRLAAWLTQAGLPAIDTVTIMLRGRWPEIRKGPRRFGLALQAWG
ncbi:GNAT family N-acetyltransferase [Reyranella soli]|uniref:N-acetyltransferase n=1 Tax=Reyranella soli TaxID=1230389 RepID=A0A512NE04_9HYPH|nr:GNAT family N-acetyltransferase [Reyranella soli]GEP57189.1 N-acetyltransferase [Reyranella soli]